jgi:DNA-directed RNA polymerase specialized sigma subunit
MLSSHTVHKINNQIQDELRIVDRFTTSHQEKMEALERIAELKKLITPQPTRSEILEELATALYEARNAPSPTATAISDLLGLLNRR